MNFDRSAPSRVGFTPETLDTQKLKLRLMEGHALHRDEILELIRGYEELQASKGQKTPAGEANLRMMAVNGN